jgi:hypothetical protein
VVRFGLAGWMCAAAVLVSASAGAQERGQVGLVIGYPTAIGVAWHPTDRIGIKGEASFAISSSEVETGPFSSDRESSTNSFGFGISGLFYVGRTDNVSTYFSPRFAYTTTTSEVEGPEVITFPEVPRQTADLRSESSIYSFAGSFGAQYSPNRRFSIFGELGLNYLSHTTKSSAFSSAETEGSVFGVRSAAGVILYFN